ncbi:MAG TPA: serine/threonine-protein kinase [Gemmatimonadaceae bacterium]|nr:serine/threonine-protein kinase [Gemmatimonadaceae bacterium]
MAGADRDHWGVLESLFDRALDLGPEERAALLGELRAGTPDVAAELEALLAGAAAAERRGFLAEPIELHESRLEGLTVGAWTLERQLGLGGMGTVWLARRSDGRFEGRAAVKLLNLALLSAEGQERFRREGSMLARLTHPGIARLLDAGVSAAGQPYLVLEYVDGQPIDEYAHERALSRDERVWLMLQVLFAVGHAHANLIVHRDLKPSNVLVSRDGAVKLLDFGIAKLIESDSVGRRLSGSATEMGVTGAAAKAEDTEDASGGGRGRRVSLTAAGTYVLTPRYAAPEQAVGEPVTTATDVYALGVLLYELLAGRHPTAAEGGTPADAMRALMEVEPARLGFGDLDAILAKALRKAPAERYQTVGAFAEDLEHYLRHEPVAARPRSLGYRARKFVRRNSTGVALGVAAAALLVGGAVRERALRGRAEAQARRAQAVEEYLVSVFGASDPYRPPGEGQPGGDVTARELLDRGAARIDSALGDQPEAQAELRGVLAHVFADLGMLDRAVPLLRRALEQRRAHYGPRHPAVAETSDQLGEALVELDRLPEAEPLLREALAQRRALLGGRDTATAASLDHLSTLLQQRGDLAAAEPLLREALDIRRAAYGSDHEAVAATLNNLGVLLTMRGGADRAEPLLREALESDRRRFGEDHPRTAQTLHNLGSAQQHRGQLDEAVALYRRALAAKRRALGDTHPSVAASVLQLGQVLAADLGRTEEGEALMREGIALHTKIYGERHTSVADGYTALGSVLRWKGGDLDGAADAYGHALAVNRALDGGVHIRVPVALNNIGGVLLARGDAAGAISHFREARALYARLMGEQSSRVAATTVDLARALRERGEAGDAREAERLFREAIGRLDSAKVMQRPSLDAARLGLGLALTDQGRAAEALPMLEQVTAARQAPARGGDDWRIGEARLALGTALLALGARARADSALAAAELVLRRHAATQPALARQAASALRRARALERGSVTPR